MQRLRSCREGRNARQGAILDDRERNALWEETREQNSRLQQLIDAIIQLIARSREVLWRQRPEDSAGGEGKSDPGS